MRVRATDGMSLPVSCTIEAPKKLPNPTPKVVMAKPVTFWLARRVTVKKQYSNPISREPKSVQINGISTAKNGLSSVTCCSYRNEPITPLIPTTYIIPGIPRFRLPDFSVKISPVAPNRIGTPCITARWNSVTQVAKLNIRRPPSDCGGTSAHN